MQATSLIQLTRIARAGANKMTGYTVTASPVVSNVYRVTNPEGVTYRVNTTPGAMNCGCKFFGENRFNPATKTGFKMGQCTCKHIEYLQEQEHYDALATAEEARELAKADAEGLAYCY